MIDNDLDAALARPTCDHPARSSNPRERCGRPAMPLAYCEAHAPETALATLKAAVHAVLADPHRLDLRRVLAGLVTK